MQDKLKNSLLNRRGFLGNTATGLSSIALTHLLSQNRLLLGRSDEVADSKKPIRPVIDPENPNRNRAPPFPCRCQKCTDDLLRRGVQSY